MRNKTMSSLLQFAKSELRAAGMFDDDSDFDGDLGAQVMALMETFCAYGHSGGSAAMTLVLFDKLARHLPINPLTGEDSEWEDLQIAGIIPVYQNTRCPTVFKQGDVAWDSAISHKPIAFPYMPAGPNNE
jgi:hypothetical protein